MFPIAEPIVASLPVLPADLAASPMIDLEIWSYRASEAAEIAAEQIAALAAEKARRSRPCGRMT